MKNMILVIGENIIEAVNTTGTDIMIKKVKLLSKYIIYTKEYLKTRTKVVNKNVTQCRSKIIRYENKTIIQPLHNIKVVLCDLKSNI